MNKIENIKINYTKMIADIVNSNKFNKNVKNKLIKALYDECNNKIRNIRKLNMCCPNGDANCDYFYNKNESINILQELIQTNMSHVKKWNEKINEIPDYSALIEIKNNNVKIINYNKGIDTWDIYNLRFIPFFNYLKLVDLTDINIKLIVLYCDNIEFTNIKNIMCDIPILCSSISQNSRKLYNNTVLIPNMYYYSKKIPIYETKINDIEYKNKQKCMNFSGVDTNKKRYHNDNWKTSFVKRKKSASRRYRSFE